MPENPLVVLVPLIISIFVLHVVRDIRRARYIRTYRFPPGLMQKFARRRPGLAYRDLQSTTEALRQFFLAYLKSGRKPVTMPSQVTDDLWHEFILYTRHYDAFCRKAFGGFLHHTPAAVMGQNRENSTGLRRVWWHTCRNEGIDPRKPARLPLLFALDGKLQVADGFVYSLDCHAHPGADRNRTPGGGGQCASDFSDSSIDGSTDGFGCGGDGGDGGCGGD